MPGRHSVVVRESGNQPLAVVVVVAMRLSAGDRPGQAAGPAAQADAPCWGPAGRTARTASVRGPGLAAGSMVVVGLVAHVGEMP